MKNLCHKSNQFIPSKEKLVTDLKKMISQNKAERPLNITSILNNLKSFIKQVYQKEWTQNIKKKNDQNNYLRAEISEKEIKLLTFHEKSRLTFNNGENLVLFVKSDFYQSKFANIYLPCKKLVTIFDFNTLKLF